MCRGKANSGKTCKRKQDFCHGYCRWHVTQDPQFGKTGVRRCKGVKADGSRCNFTEVMPVSFDFLAKSILLAFGFDYCGGHLDQLLMKPPLRLPEEDEKAKPDEKAQTKSDEKKQEEEQKEDGSDLVFMDLETTGLGLIRDETLEIYMESASNSYESFVSPTVPISEGASNIHKMDDKFLKDRNTKSLERQIPSLLSFLEMQDRPVFIAHNGDRFDYPMLMFDLLRASQNDENLRKRVIKVYSNMRFMDTCKMAKALYPELKEREKDPRARVYSVEKLSETFKVKEFDQEHRARSDVKIMIAVYNHMLKDKKLTKAQTIQRFATQIDVDMGVKIFNAAKKNFDFEKVYDDHVNSVEMRLKSE